MSTRPIARSQGRGSRLGGSGIGTKPIDAVIANRSARGRRTARDAIACMIRSAISSSLSALRRGDEDQELLAAPAHDHVGLAQRLAQPLRDGDQHRVAGRVPVAVVGLLEVVDVDQQQRLDRLAVARAGARRGRAASRMKSWK